jgi:DNA-binding winged helix-turn-helix (wHTH) protein
MPARYFVFASFCLDLLDERLWKHEESIPLGRKAFAVLARLVAAPDQLVTKEDLLASVWPATAVTEAVLTTAVREIRVAVGDRARTPSFIETVHGRGYRFIAPVAEDADRLKRAPSPTPAETVPLVGRQAEWDRLEGWFSAVRNGVRHIGFIAGDAGIGKTTLVDAFVAGIAVRNGIRVSRGQCIEQYGAGEAYLPILEAVGRLARGADPLVERVLRTQAPSWLAHLSLLPRASAPDARVPAGRMLRELAEAVETLAAAEPLVLLLEDLHWSDRATLQWIAYVTRRRDPAQLLVLGTYRPLETLPHTNPLRAALGELRHQPQCGEIVLDSLSGDAVRDYLRQRCGSIPEFEELSGALHRRTGGHPLFLAAIVDELIERRAAAPAHLTHPDVAMGRTIPANVRQFIEHGFEHLSADDEAILEAASVAGDPFSVAAVAAGTSLSEDRIEARCAILTNANRILTAAGIARWPDGTLAARFQFRHGLFQEAAYARISPERRARLHLLIGRRLETAFAGPAAAAMAAELAVHFEHGRDPRRAVSHLEQAARNALHRSAYPEAQVHLGRALTFIETLPDGHERLRREANLSLLLAQVLEATRGWAGEEVAHAYARARDLCLALGDESSLLQATWGLIAVSVVRAELRKTEDLTRDVLRLAKKRRSPLFRMAAHTELGGTALVLGKTASARRHFRLAEALGDRGGQQSSIPTFGMDMGIFARIWATHVTWQEGYPDRARAGADEAMDLAGRSGHPFTQTVTLAYAAMLAQFRRDVSEVDRLTQATIAHATEHGFPYYLAWAQVLRDWSRATQGAGDSAVAGIRAGIDALQAIAGLRVPYYRGLYAEACGRSGRLDEGLAAVAEALHEVRKTEERWWEAELHHLRGGLLVMSPDGDGEAEECFCTAIDIARGQRALSLELRAAVSLARLWRRHGKCRGARPLLAGVYGKFTEGFDTSDLRDARSVLDEQG